MRTFKVLTICVIIILTMTAGAHFSESSVQKLTKRGIIDRLHVFEPDDIITKDDFYGMASRSLDYDGITHDNAARAFDNLGDGSYVTREEAASVFAVAYGLADEPETAEGFSDYSEISSFALGHVGALKKIGSLLGDNGNFEPKRLITYAETAVLLQRLHERMYVSAAERDTAKEEPEPVAYTESPSEDIPDEIGETAGTDETVTPKALAAEIPETARVKSPDKTVETIILTDKLNKLAYVVTTRLRTQENPYAVDVLEGYAKFEVKLDDYDAVDLFSITIDYGEADGKVYASKNKITFKVPINELSYNKDYKFGKISISYENAESARYEALVPKKLVNLAFISRAWSEASKLVDTINNAEYDEDKKAYTAAYDGEAQSVTTTNSDVRIEIKNGTVKAYAHKSKDADAPITGTLKTVEVDGRLYDLSVFNLKFSV